MAKKRKKNASVKPALSKKNRTGKVPVGVKVISVLYYIVAVISILTGLVLIIGSDALRSYLDTLFPTTLLAGMIAVFGVISILFAVLFFFIARGLWKGQKWARIVAIIFAVIGLLSALVSVANGYSKSIIDLIVHALIGGYLLFSSDVKRVFA
jgi:lysylphosphatidylglycerol synthetase-like protein (DUF2156 family)